MEWEKSSFFGCFSTIQDTLTAYTRVATKFVFYIAKPTAIELICASENERLRVNKIKHLVLYIGEAKLSRSDKAGGGLNVE